MSICPPNSVVVIHPWVDWDLGANDSTQRHLLEVLANSESAETNQGVFLNGEQAYVYVVDETGAISEQGLPVVVGQESGSNTTPPAAVTTVGD
jgi:hypothetical protein